MDDKNVVLYTTHCPRCMCLELMLKKKNIQYTEKYIDQNKAEEIQIMVDMGLSSAPGLVVDGEVLDYPKAMAWVRGR